MNLLVTVLYRNHFNKNHRAFFGWHSPRNRCSAQSFIIIKKKKKTGLVVFRCLLSNIHLYEHLHVDPRDFMHVCTSEFESVSLIIYRLKR